MSQSVPVTSAAPSDRDRFEFLSDPALRKRLIEAAIRAPSGDNCQPWRFRFDDRKLHIELMLDRAASFFDFQHRGSLLSLGAVAQNVRTQAECEGISAFVSAVPGPGPDAIPTVDVAFELGSPPDLRSRSLATAMHNRTVNRRPFLPVRIAREKRRAWNSEVPAGTEITVIEERREMARWARVSCLADRIRWTHPTIHAELFASIRFTRGEADYSRTGLEIDRLGAGPLAGPIMRWLQPWRRMSRLHRYGVDRLLASQTRALALCSGALVLVTIDRNEPTRWVRAGEQVQRLWNIAQQQGLCVQPLPVALYLDQRFQAEGTAHFLQEHRTLLEELRQLLSALLGGRTGAMLYRVGYGVRMGHTAVRLPTESFYDANRQPLKDP